MIAVVVDDMVKLVIEELRGGRILVDRKRPVGQFHLTIEAHLVGDPEGSLGRAPRSSIGGVPVSGKMQHSKVPRRKVG